METSKGKDSNNFRERTKRKEEEDKEDRI